MKREDDEVTRLVEGGSIEASGSPRFGVDWAGEARGSDETVGGEHTLFAAERRIPLELLPGVPRQAPRLRERGHAARGHEPSFRSRTHAGLTLRLGGGVLGALVGIALSVLGLGLCSGSAAGEPAPGGVGLRMEPPERPSLPELGVPSVSSRSNEENTGAPRRRGSASRAPRHRELELHAVRALWSGDPERALELYRELAERSEDRSELISFVQILERDRKERGSR